MQNFKSYSKEDKGPSRILTLSEITSESANYVISNIYEINLFDDLIKNTKREPIKLIINSEGGDIYPGLGIIDVIEASNTHVHTICHGQAMSMAFAVFCTGHKRFASSRATFMYHESSYDASTEKLKNHEAQINEIKRIDNLIDKLVIEKTKITQYILKKMRKEGTDWFMGTKEALKYKVVDEII